MRSPDNNPVINKLSAIGRVHYPAILLGMACIVFQVTDMVEFLRFNRTGIETGQWWRLITGNLVHLGYPHLWLNLAGLAVISALLATALAPWQWLTITIISMAGVGLGLLFRDPHLQWYVGLSGVLYGLLLGGAIAEFRRQPLIATVLAVYTIGKVVWEQLYGAADSSEKITGGNVIVNAHLYGMVAGGTAALVLLFIARLHKK